MTQPPANSAHLVPGNGLGCEFCDEFSGKSQNRFSQIYGGLSRTIIRENGFVAVPTIGQLFPGSMLVLPVSHVERMADLKPKELERCLQLVQKVKSLVSLNGIPLVFEHGARCFTGGSCGIYHAHFHIVPLPKNEPLIRASDLMPKFECFQSVETIKSALEMLSQSDEYLLVQEDEISTVFMDASALAGCKLSSQHIRKQLVSFYGLKGSWDWRTYTIESDVVMTIEKFKSRAA